MKSYVLDTSAMIAYLLDEPGAEIVDEIVNDTQLICNAHAINLCEVFYDFFRSGDISGADLMGAQIASTDFSGANLQGVKGMRQ